MKLSHETVENLSHNYPPLLIKQSPPRRRVVHSHPDPDAEEDETEEEEESSSEEDTGKPVTVTDLAKASFPALTRFMRKGIFTLDFTDEGREEMRKLTGRWMKKGRMPSRLARQWCSRGVKIDPAEPGEKEKFKLEDLNRKAVYKMFELMGLESRELEKIVKAQWEEEGISYYRPPEPRGEQVKDRMMGKATFRRFR